jgi:VWFA-related protein
MYRLALISLCLAVVAASAAAQNRPRTANKPALKGETRTSAPKKSPTVTNRTTIAPEEAAVVDVPPPVPGKKRLEDEEIKVDTNLVTTPVSVLDRQGRFIPNLRQRDFKIFDNGVPQKVTWFQSSEQPFTVVLMIDISPSTRYSIDDIRFAAVTFVEQLRPTDKVMVVNFDRQVRVMTEPTNDKKALYTAIYKSAFGSGTSLYEAVDAAVNLDFVKIPGRKAIVLFTDGVDTTSRRASFESTITGVEEVDALIYPVRYDTQDGTRDPQVALRGIGVPQNVINTLTRGTARGDYERGREYLNMLAESSGGRMFEAGEISNLEAAFKNVAEELRRQYAVGYYPDDTGQAGDRRKIKVQVARPGAIVRSKSAYVIKGSDEGYSDSSN